MREWPLRKWRGTWRKRTAGMLVVLYTLCLAAPTAVLAFGQSRIPAHCLTLQQQGTETAHLHQGEHGSRHHHSGGDRGQTAAKCCGLFSVSAIAPLMDIFIDREPPVSLRSTLVTESLSGCAADRIDRPPRSLLSV